jgi:hypothetical protein
MSADVPVGLYRTFVRILDDSRSLTYETWCEGLRAGRTFATGGPLLRFTVDGEGPGATLRVGAGASVEIEARADSIFPIQSLEVVLNGHVVARVSAHEAGRSLTLRQTLTIDEDSWVAARCGGSRYFDAPAHHDRWHRCAIAHTSPVYLAIGAQWSRLEHEAANPLLKLLRLGREHVRRAVQWPEALVTHRHDTRDHLSYLEEPFVEAIRLLETRLAAAQR